MDTHTALSCLRAAADTVASRAPQLAATIASWTIEAVGSRLPPVVDGTPPRLVAGVAWLAAKPQSATERRVAQLAFQSLHGLLEPPPSIRTPEDGQLWELGITMLFDAALRESFPPLSRERELIAAISALISHDDQEVDALGIFGALKRNEAQVDDALDTH